MGITINQKIKNMNTYKQLELNLNIEKFAKWKLEELILQSADPVELDSLGQRLELCNNEIARIEKALIQYN